MDSSCKYAIRNIVLLTLYKKMTLFDFLSTQVEDSTLFIIFILLRIYFILKMVFIFSHVFNSILNDKF